MSLTKVKLEFPIHVSNVKMDGRDQYQIKPLLFDFGAIIHRRYDTALARFQTMVVKQLKGLELNRSTADRLNWFCLYPKVDFRIYKLKIPVIGKPDFEGTYGIAVFEIKGIYFACLPAMNSFMFILKIDERGKADLYEQAPKVIAELMKRYRDYDPENFTFQQYTSTKKEFVTSLKTNIQVDHDSFSFEKNLNTFFFDAFGGNEDLNGANEIWRVGQNLSSQTNYGLKSAFFQEKMVARLHEILFQIPFKNTPIAIIGKEGVGKHSVVHEALKRYAQNQKIKKHRELWHIDPTRIITGMSIVGMWQKRLEAILKFTQNPYNENRGADILMVDNAVAMLRIGQSAQNSMTVNDVLKPYLEKRQVQFIILATPEEWKVIQEKDRRFADLFQLIRMDEPDLETAVKMTLENRKVLESQHGCEISVKAVQALFDFRRNFLKRKALPGSVIKMMTQLALQYRGQTIDLPQIRREFESFSGLTENMFDATKPLEKDAIKNHIAQELVGQPQAVQTLADVIHTMKAKLASPDKPLGSFLFIGPTGVGKTQAAKVLCKYITGSEEHLMQFDMNEFIDHTAVQRLIGNAQNPEGQLTGKVRYQPFGVVLLDEIEKAHPQVHDLLLQILDDARLTDSLGRTVDFSNTIIIMTSNIGAREVARKIGPNNNTNADSAIYRKAVENQFRPEFINRIDEIVIFNSLSLEHILNIAWLQINDLLKRDGFVRRTTLLNISTEALEWVAHRGFNERMGGRALKRQIEKDLTALTAEQLIGTYSKSPILFEIFLKPVFRKNNTTNRKKLVPKVSKLSFVEPLSEGWFPKLPEPERGKKFYIDLLKILEKMQRQIQRMERADYDEMVVVDVQNQSQYYSFKEKIAETKERITNLSLGFRDNKFRQGPAIPLRLKRNMIWSGNDKIHKENYRDLFFQQEGLAEINEIYNQTTAQFNSIQTEFLNSYLDVAFLRLFSKDFNKNRIQKITIRLESCITNVGEEQMDYLCDLLEKVLQKLHIDFQVAPKKSDEPYRRIHLEGHSLQSLLAGEAGIHLFHLPYQNPIPIRLILEKENANGKPKLNNRVIRIYDNEKTLTDFRTGFANATNITAEEFKLLLFAGIAENIRSRLIA